MDICNGYRPVKNWTDRDSVTIGLLPAADLLAALQKQAAIPPTQQGDRTPDLHETEFVLEVLKLAAKVAPLLLL